MKGVKVTQLAPNHFTIYDEVNGVRYFQSYNSVIVKIEKGKVTLGKHWKYSNTTSKHRSAFLSESTAETQRKLDNGEYAYDPEM